MIAESTRLRSVIVMPFLARPIVTLCLVLSGCGLIMIGQPVEPIDITSQDDGQENLKAIRAMLAEQARRPVPSVVKPSDASQVSFPPHESKPVSEPYSAVDVVTPSSSSSTGNADAPAKLPWTPPSIRRSSPPDRSVPAYTIPAPVGPDYSGSIRCAPDGLGGQRCLGR